MDIAKDIFLENKKNAEQNFKTAKVTKNKGIHF